MNTKEQSNTILTITEFLTLYLQAPDDVKRKVKQMLDAMERGEDITCKQ